MSESEPISPEGDTDVGPPERLHPLFLLSGLGGSLRGLFGGYAAIGYLVVSGRRQMALYGGLALLLFSAISVLVYWRRFSFRVGTREVRIDSGLVNRRHRSIPFDRIQDVDITQGPLARLLGLAQVKFETGSASSGPNADEAVLHAITVRRAHEIRELVRGHAGASSPSLAAAAGADERPPIYAMTPRRLLLAGLFNFSLAVFAGLFGLTQTMGDLIGFDPLSRRFWTNLAEDGAPIVQFLFANRAGAVLAGIALLLIIGVATGVVRTVLRDFGFRLDATGTGLRRRRGLLTRTDVTLPAKRAQAVLIGTGPIRQRFGWSDFHVQSLAQDEGSKGDHLLAPLASEEEIAAVLSELGWRPLAGSIDWQPISKTYVAQFLIMVTPLVLIAAAAAFSRPIALAGLGAIAGLVIVRWLNWRRNGYALDGDRLLIRRGWFRRRLLILPLGKIQSIDLSQNFISRRFGTMALRFGVAGGGGFSSHFIPAIPSSKARQLRDELLDSVR